MEVLEANIKLSDSDLSVDVNAKYTNVRSQCAFFGQGNVGAVYMSDDCFGGDIGLRNGLNDAEMAVYIPFTQTYRYGGGSLLAFSNSDGGFGGDTINGIGINADDAYINFSAEPSGVIGSQGYGFRDNGGVMQYKDAGGNWIAFSSLGGGGSSNLQAVTDNGNTTTNGVTVGSIYVPGVSDPVDAPTNLTAVQTCVTSCNYFADGNQGSPRNYRVYSYKNVGSGRVYSSSYVTLLSDFVDDGSNTNYNVTVSWDPAANVDGYRVLVYDPTYYGFNYDGGYDTVSTSFVDDGCDNVCFETDQSSVASTSSYTNANTINGILSLSDLINMDGGVFGMSTGNFFAVSGYNPLTLPINNSNFLGENAGYNAVNATDSNFFGNEAGSSATDAYYSNFFGQQAGYNASGASYSNFSGYRAGYNAYSAQNSNFFGQRAGYNAYTAEQSNFLGYRSGYQAGNANNSNFLGQDAGYQAVNANRSNFLGYIAGYNATSAANSNFLGYSAGYGATGASSSNFLGSQTGVGAVSANNSNFFGQRAGANATNAANSNFFGYEAGGSLGSDTAANASFSNFFGYRAGYRALNAGGSNFFGSGAGYDAIAASGSNFFGSQAGQGAINASNSNFMSYQAGYNATDATYSNFFGFGSGSYATNATYSNFLGYQAGRLATSANNSNFFGFHAGNEAPYASHSNFFGYEAGQNASSANSSNFMGYQAGYNSASANSSNFFGYTAGRSASGAYESNFFGNGAGYGATSASVSNFLGSDAGRSASNAFGSNFLGSGAGRIATNAAFSNFLGHDAGNGAVNASNSIFIGKASGYGDTVNNTASQDDYSILIGQNTSTGGFSNSIAIGSTATNTAANQLMIGSTTRPINEVVIKGSGTCSIVATGISCSSDERLKTNIEDLENTTLDTIVNIRTVRYNWNSDPMGAKTLGFLAQDLERYYPELVRTDSDGFRMVNYAQMTPILVEAIREMNLKIATINDMDTPNTWRDAITSWLGNIANGINDLFAKRVHVEQLCVGTAGNETCLTKDQVDNILNSTNGTSYTPPVIVPPSNDPEPGDGDTPTDTPTDNSGADQTSVDGDNSSSQPAPTE